MTRISVVTAPCLPEFLFFVFDGVAVVADLGEGVEHQVARGPRPEDRRRRDNPAALRSPGPGARLTVAADILREYGYQPITDGAEAERRMVRLRNCPFHPLARQYPELVCGLNEAFIGGVLDGLGARGIRAVLAIDPVACCVQLHTGAAPAPQ